MFNPCSKMESLAEPKERMSDQHSEMLKKTAFGKSMRDQHFLFDQGYVNLNQGSFGSHPRHVRNALRSFQDEAEAKPDVLIRYIFPERLNQIRVTLGKMLNVTTDELVIVPNATTGFNSVVRNLKFEHGDKIVYFSTIYGAMEKTLQYLEESTPVQTIEVKYTLPMSNEQLVETFCSVLKEHSGSVKVAVFDTITSLPGVRMPFEQLTQSCRDHGVMSLIDGAHGIGHIPLDVGSLQPDFLVTNCHKWLFVPRAVAVLYVPFRNQHLMRSSIPTSHRFVQLDAHKKKSVFNPLPASKTQNAFAAQFEYTGTADTAPVLCLPAALEFRKTVCGGEDLIQKYRFELAEKGEQEVVRLLETTALTIPEGARVAFANVWLPLVVSPTGDRIIKGAIPFEDVPAVTAFLTQELIASWNCYIAITFYSGSWLARFSAEIYLDIDDFVYGARALKAVCDKVRKGGYRS